MPRRSYQQFCGLARALDLVGERWTLLLVRDLLLGPRRYGELLEAMPGLTTNLLAKRLHEMQAAGLVETIEERGVRMWALTADGRALEPAIMELARWGGRTLGRPRRGERVDVGWALLSVKRRYRAGGLGRRVVGLTVDTPRGTRRFELADADGWLSVLERAPQRPDLTVDGKMDAVLALWFSATPAAELVGSGRLRVTGAPDAWDAFLASFSASS